MNLIKQYDREEIRYIIYVMFILTSVIALTSWSATHPDSLENMILKCIRYVSYLGCVICIAMNVANRKYSIRSFYFLVFMLLTSGVAMLASGERTVFLFVLLLGCMYGCDGEKILKISCIVQGSALLLTTFAALMGVISNPIVDAERMRYSLGFAWASYAPNLLLFVSMQYMLIRRNKISWLEIAVIEALNVCFFFQTDTKMSFLILTFLCVLMVLNKVTNIRKGLLRVKHQVFKLKKGYMLLPWLCALLAILLPLYRQESIFWNVLNKGFSGRLLYGKNALMDYGLSFFGQAINMEGFSVAGRTTEVYNYVDSSYLQIAIRYGIVLLICVCLLYGMGLLKMYRRKDGRAVLFLLVILLLCMEEPFLFDAAFNLAPVFIVCDKDALNAPYYSKIVRKKKVENHHYEN